MAGSNSNPVSNIRDGISGKPGKNDGRNLSQNIDYGGRAALHKKNIIVDSSTRDGKGVGKQYVGIGRMNFINDPPSQRSAIKKPVFDPAEGRDYEQDAPGTVKPFKTDRDSSHSARSEKEKNVIVPEIKSPAQVAAEKAAEWKR